MTLPNFSARIRRVFRELSIELLASETGPSEFGAPKLSHRVSPEADALALNQYLQLLSDWNTRLDLTAARNHDELVDLFVADACVLAALAPKTRSRWVDVGSGAGAPGVALKVLRPDLDLTLVEPLSKRISFLRTVLGSLELDGVSAQKLRTQQLTERSYETAVSRATLSPQEWLTEGVRLSSGCVWVLLAQDEPPQSNGWRVVADVRYDWPLTGVSRRAVCYTQTADPL